MKVAVTDFAEVTETVHVDELPEHDLPHPENRQPSTCVAVRTTDEPLSKDEDTVPVPVDVMPDGLDEMFPVPVCTRVTL